MANYTYKRNKRKAGWAPSSMDNPTRAPRRSRADIEQDKAFLRELRKANAHPVRCWLCGQWDNDWPARRGLCLDCYARLRNAAEFPRHG